MYVLLLLLFYLLLYYYSVLLYFFWGVVVVVVVVLVCCCCAADEEEEEIRTAGIAGKSAVTGRQERTLERDDRASFRSIPKKSAALSAVKPAAHDTLLEVLVSWTKVSRKAPVWVLGASRSWRTDPFDDRG